MFNINTLINVTAHLTTITVFVYYILEPVCPSACLFLNIERLCPTTKTQVLLFIHIQGNKYRLG